MLQKLKNATIYDALMFTAILFSGTDIWALNLGVNIRYIQIIYVAILFIYIFKYEPRLKFRVGYVLWPLFLFVFSGYLSTLFAIDRIQSVKYLVWIFYTVLILIPMFYLYVSRLGINKLETILKTVVVVLFILIVGQLILDMILKIELPFLRSQHHEGVTRVALWFYEPSYLASFMAIFVGYFAYRVFINNRFDLIKILVLAVLCMVATTSTTGFMAIAFLFALIVFAKVIAVRDVREKAIILSIALIILVIAITVMALAFRSVFDKFVLRIFSQGLAKASGERISDYGNQFDAFKSAPIFGVGLDCYGVFMGDPSLVASNISLELLATMGVFGFIAFYLIFAVLLFEVFISKRRKCYHISKAIVFSTLFLIVVLQANQNFMRLYLWMMVAISYGATAYEKRNNIENKEPEECI